MDTCYCWETTSPCLDLGNVPHVTITMSRFSSPRSSIEEQRDLWERKRSITAKELVQTEQCYCQQLHLVTTYFVEILKAKGTLKQDIQKSIFSSIKDIDSINQSLLVHLENGYFGKGFDQFCPNLQYYTTYVDNIYNASKVLRIQLKKNKAFRRFKELQETRPEFNNHKLEDLLQLPIQRIDQYKHFLQNLTANTRPDNPEFQQLSRRWYIREGWLKVVPPKGAEAKQKMFFLFSDMLLQAKRCSVLHPTNGEKFTGQHAYPLQDCTAEKVFGHTKSQGGLLSLTFPKAKLLLMSSNQEDLNDWYQNLCSAIRKLQSAQTVVHQRDERCQGPLRSAADSHNTPNSSSSINPGRKRNMGSCETGVQAQKPSLEWESSTPKRMKQSEPPQLSGETSASGCVIL
ncbi:rho guanine nucleotide exchange factor 39 isoform X3 [Anabas testudineus]|uniref:rho guanine nucleotide exchange factor 39 isoform X3 n=1 Tax=Anabas testudineus TaxID=64144 RepID=UPI000E45FD94|nr:rho guanine nucleotide exchange factor 39 isoform X3 [Anabas testudineus]